ncbi:MAG: hypothetical protein JNL23_01575 [Chitinophagaceae bacterium]|nr:hypothetical protein [Chitinophagaceae bacterium]
MEKDKVEKIIDNLIETDFFDSKERKLTPEEIELLKNNPHLLEKLTDSSLIKKKYIYIVFSISMTLMVASKVFQYTKLFEGSDILNDIFTNVLFSISMEMLGACIIAYMLEIMFERRLRRNQELTKMILDKFK